MFTQWMKYHRVIALCVLTGVSVSAYGGLATGSDPHGKPCVNPPSCCCFGSAAGGSSGSGASGSSDSNGMPTYSVNPMLIGLVLHDTPLSYRPPKGPAIDFQITYNQKDTDQPSSFTFGNLGPK